MTNITSSMDITLVTLQNCPSDLTVIHQIFDKAAELGIDIDMISLAPSRNVFPIIYHVGPRPAKAVDILQPPAQ